MSSLLEIAPPYQRPRASANTTVGSGTCKKGTQLATITELQETMSHSPGSDAIPIRGSVCSVFRGGTNGPVVIG